MTEVLQERQLTQLSDFVAAHMGLHFPHQRRRELERGIGSAAPDFGFNDVASCVQWLLSTPLTKPQIETLASHLTVGETYFFREQQSFQILEERVLPELINKRRGTDQRLRIWSAGCCTGEEPYSIAMLLKQVLPDLKDWQITLLATDINPHYLKKAVDGIYGDWSFRGLRPGTKERYFVKKNHGRFEILPDIKRTVTFSYLNLVEDSYPSLLNNTNAMDLIFCRNVLMYFAPERAKQVIRKFHHALLDGGWLVVSPSETSHILYSQFSTVSFPDVIFYKKERPKASPAVPSRSEEETKPLIQPTLLCSFPLPPDPEPPFAEQAKATILAEISAPTIANPEPPLYAKSSALYEQGRYEEAAQTVSELLARDPHDPKAMALLARVYANQGKLTDAIQWCEKALAADKLDPACHILHATILQEQGATVEATRSLQRALYLDQNLVLAHFVLGNITRQQGKHEEATRHFENARTLLDAYSPQQILPESEGMTAGRLMEIISSTNSAQLPASSGKPAHSGLQINLPSALRKPQGERKGV